MAPQGTKDRTILVKEGFVGSHLALVNPRPALPTEGPCPLLQRIKTSGCRLTAAWLAGEAVMHPQPRGGPNDSFESKKFLTQIQSHFVSEQSRQLKYSSKGP